MKKFLLSLSLFLLSTSLVLVSLCFFTYTLILSRDFNQHEIKHQQALLKVENATNIVSKVKNPAVRIRLKKELDAKTLKIRKNIIIKRAIIYNRILLIPILLILIQLFGYLSVLSYKKMKIDKKHIQPLNKKYFLKFLTKGFVVLLIIVGAIGVDEYSYYQFLRVVVCSYCLYGLYKLDEEDFKDWRYYSLCIIGILFNPIIPVPLQRETWIIIDIISAILISLISIHKSNSICEFIKKKFRKENRVKIIASIILIFIPLILFLIFLALDELGSDDFLEILIMILFPIWFLVFSIIIGRYISSFFDK